MQLQREFEPFLCATALQNLEHHGRLFLFGHQFLEPAVNNDGHPLLQSPFLNFFAVLLNEIVFLKVFGGKFLEKPLSTQLLLLLPLRLLFWKLSELVH